MNILIITSFFPPDSTIAAVRPYMFAKHLSAMGENVTVLRTGDFDLKPFDEYEEDDSFEVISALGENCPAEKFRRGEYEGFKTPDLGKLHKLPRQVRVPLKALRDFISVLHKQPPKYFRKSWASLEAQKKTINQLHASNKSFDVVFSTCGELENIYAGQYAAEKFKAKWIMDFRDSMVRKGKNKTDYWRNYYGKKATIYAIKNADMLLSVSEGLRDDLNDFCRTDKIRVVYNGFDDLEILPSVNTDNKSLSFCYTGRTYEDSIPVLSCFVHSLSKLIKNGSIDRERVKFFYAGSSTQEISKVFEQEKISDILENRGYLSKTETLKLQLFSDVFTVISWNTRNSRGILTGKFYEGIKIGKPILVLVSGNLPNSELLELQKRYNYGFCYEQSSGKHALPSMEEYILNLYKTKISKGRIDYSRNLKLYEEFSYSVLTKKLHEIMLELLNGA